MSLFWILLELIIKGDGGGGDNWGYMTCKAPVNSSPPTNQHLPVVFLQAGCLSCRPTNSVKVLKGSLTCHLSTKFCENWPSSFWTILLTNKQRLLMKT